jgi:hypothetical protein
VCVRRASYGGQPSHASESEGWRRRPDLSRGWRFCRPSPVPLGRSVVSTIAPKMSAAQSDRPIASSRSSCVALAETGRRGLAAGTVRAQLNARRHALHASLFRSKCYQRVHSCRSARRQ